MYYVGRISLPMLLLFEQKLDLWNKVKIAEFYFTCCKIHNEFFDYESSGSEQPLSHYYTQKEGTSLLLVLSLHFHFPLPANTEYNAECSSCPARTELHCPESQRSVVPPLKVWPILSRKPPAYVMASDWAGNSYVGV